MTSLGLGLGLNKIRKRGGAAPIFAREFDGVNDFMALDQSYSWENQSVKFDVILDAPSDTYHMLAVLSSDNINSRILTAHNVNNGRLFVGSGSENDMQLYSPGVRTTITVTHNGADSYTIHTSYSNTTFQKTYVDVVHSLDRFGADNSRFWMKGILIEAEVNGNVFNEANNWRGATINGPVLVQI